MINDQLPTPSPVASPEVQKPRAQNEKAKGPVNRCKPRRTFDKQQDNDRNYYEQWISKMISDEQRWDEWGFEERSNAVVGEWKRLRDFRSKHFTMRSAFADFPELYDAQAERQAILEAFEDEIRQLIGNGCGEARDERDDEEELPTERPIKTEPKADNESESGSDAEQMDEDPAECKVVSRGFVIIEDDAAGGVGRFGAKKTTGAKAASAASKARDVPQDIRKVAAGRGTQRSWKWKGGKMMVWPSFDAFD